MNAHRVYHRGHRRAWSAFLQASIRTEYSTQAEERVIARTKPQKSNCGQQSEVRP